MGFLAGVVAPLLSLAAFITWIWLTGMAFKKSVGWGVLVLLFSPFSAIFFALKFWDEAKKPFLIHIGCVTANVIIFVLAMQALGVFQMMSTASQIASGEISEEEIPGLIEEQLDRMESSGLLSDEDKAELAKMRAELRETARQNASNGDAAPAATYEDVRPRRPADDSRPFVSDPPVSVELDPIGGNLPRVDWRDSVPTGPTTSFDELSGGVVPVRKAEGFVGKPFAVELKNGLEYKGRLSKVHGGSLVFEKYMSGGVVSFEIAKNDIDELRLRGR